MNKMNPINRFGVGLITSAMIASGAIVSGLSPVVALAANGVVTIAQKDNTTSPYDYDAFQIFHADVVNDNGDYKASHITWAGADATEQAAVKSAVITFIGGLDDDNDTEVDYDTWLATKYGFSNTTDVQVSHRENAQNVAEYLAYKIDNSANDTGANTTPDTKQGDSFAARLSRSLYAAGLSSTTVTQGQAASLDQGYWLITSDPADIANGEAGSAPMWVAVSDTPLTITEKTDVPTIEKTVKGDDADENTFAKVADAGAGNDANVDFKIDSTVPDNVDAFSSYRVSVADTLPAGMALEDGDISSVAVELAGVDITSILKTQNSPYGSITYANGVLTVTINNVKDSEHLNDADVLTDKTFVITYRAHLSGTSTIGASNLNENTAVLTYDADPNDSTITKTVESEAAVACYQATLTKLDKATRLPLQGAGFTAKTTISGTDYYLKANGELTDDPTEAYEFVSDANGQIVFPRLDEGTYVIEETTAPTDYELMDNPITLTIDATKDRSNGTITALTGTVSGGEGMTSGTVNAAVADGITGTTLATGDVSMAVSNDYIVKLPLTGLPVATAALYAGATIALVSIVAIIAKKKEEKE